MITAEEIEKAKTANGGWTREQFAAWGVSWPPPKGWKDRLIDRACAQSLRECLSSREFDGSYSVVRWCRDELRAVIRELEGRHK